MRRSVPSRHSTEPGTARLGRLTLDASRFPALVLGCRLLGSGGGGDPTLWALLARAVLGGRSLTVSDPADLDGDDLVIASGMLGSPAITTELVPEGGEFVRAVQALERHLGRSAAAVMGLETAGVNAFPPIIVAASLGLPLLDLDGMGRAYPRIDHTVLHARGVPIGAIVSVGVAGEVVIIDPRDASRAEALARSTLGPLGGWVAHACYATTVARAAGAAIAGTLERALALGEACAVAADPADLARRMGGRLLGRGRVLALERADVSGLRATVLIDDASVPGATLRLEFQSEYLIASRDGTVLATTPDLIVVVDSQTLEPISCERIRRGGDVVVIGLPCDPAWRESAALALAGPAAFGYPGVEVL